MFSARINRFLICSTAVALISGCAILEKKDSDEESSWIVRQFEKDGAKEASKATIAYSEGEFKKALELASESLRDNPRLTRAAFSVSDIFLTSSPSS